VDCDTCRPGLSGATARYLFIGLSTWYSPFGWIAWGPRLTLTLLPAMLMVACCLAADRATDLLRQFLAGRFLWPAAVVTILIGIPQATEPFAPRAISKFFGPIPQCAGAHIGQSPKRYYRCVDFTAWQKRPLLLQRGLEGLRYSGGRVMAVLFSGAVVAVLALARGAARRDFSRASDADGKDLHAPLALDANM
jgi:hypothetical protein